MWWPFLKSQDIVFCVSKTLHKRGVYLTFKGVYVIIKMYSNMFKGENCAMENLILVVDDEKPIVEILKVNLVKSGYRVIEAYD